MMRDMTLMDAMTVCADMRPQDAECVRAMTGMEPGEWFAVDRWQSDGPAWTVDQNGQPWAIGGLNFTSRWAGALWMVARPGLSLHSWRKVTRVVRTVLQITEPAHQLHRHRVEALVLANWPEAQHFASHLGLEYEGTRRAIGSGKQDVQTWAKVTRG